MALAALLLAFGLEFAACQNNSNSLLGTCTGNALLIGETSFTFASYNTVTTCDMGLNRGSTYVLSGRISAYTVIEAKIY